MLGESQILHFAEQGWLHVAGGLDPAKELGALDRAYQRLVGDLAERYYAEVGQRPPGDFAERSLGSRFALMQGASGGLGAEHLDPSLGLFAPGYRRGKELPGTQIPELFDVMRAAGLLDAVEALLGPEIELTPRHHLNFKLSPGDLELAAETARAVGQRDPRTSRMHGFHVGQTPLHCDAPFASSDARENRVITVWVPMVPAGGDVGSLVVVPRSHRLPRGERPGSDAEEIEVVAKPGDLVLLDSWTFHRSTPNCSDGGIRWAFNFRYVERGAPGGRPYLPTVLVRSRKDPQQVLTDGTTWQRIWQRALDHLERPTLPIAHGGTVEEARRVAEAWRRSLPDVEAWMSLEPMPLPTGWRRVRPALGRLKRAALARLPRG